MSTAATGRFNIRRKPRATVRRTTRDLSTDEIAELAAAFGIEVGDLELEDLQDRVNRRLDGLDEVYEIPIAEPDTPGERTWSKPTDGTDPYNALSTVCEVPASGDGPLSGLEVGLKDNIAVAGVPMECASTVMEGFIPSEDAPVVSRLLAAGATITAKTNLDEFAGGGRGMAADGQIRHPSDPDRYPGGSSGGSATAVAAGQVDIALGTDTGGSVRAPAAVCGLVGVKPTYGLVPIAGVVENTYSLDHVGVLTRTVAEAATCLDAIAGKTERDPASMAAAGRDGYEVGGYGDAAAEPLDPSEMTLGVLVESFRGGEEPVFDRVEAAIEELEAAGATVLEVSLPEAELVDTIKNCITYPELAQYWRDGGVPLRRGGGESRDQVGFARRAEAASGELNAFYRGRILAGAQLLEAHDGRHYSRALAVRRALRERIEERFAADDLDAIVSPTVPGVAPKHEDADDPGFGITANTRIANVTELPAVTVPCGTVEGLPVGLQLLGERFAERTLFRAAAGLEDRIDGG